MTDLAGCRILVVDDRTEHLVVLDELLRSDGFSEIRTTSDPDAVVGAVTDGAVDLLVVDLEMPRVSGVELLAQVRERLDPSDYVPILIVTAHASPALRRQTLAHGAQDIVLKPFDPVELLLRVRNLLTTRALHVELVDQRRTLMETVERHEHEAARREALRAEMLANIERALDPSSLQLVFQPVYALGDPDGPIGLEALTRFRIPPARPPDAWFAEAGAVGCGVALELASVAAAVGVLDQLPGGVFLAVNLSPEVVLGADLGAVLRDADLGRIVLELTEHAPVADYGALHAALAPLRTAGLRLAVDDAGAGYASFQHILRLRPDVIKLDLDLTRGIDGDPVRRALAAALVTFGHEVGAQLVAEGVETYDELGALADIGFDGAQGYLLGRPAPLDELGLDHG